MQVEDVTLVHDTRYQLRRLGELCKVYHMPSVSSIIETGVCTIFIGATIGRSLAGLRTIVTRVGALNPACKGRSGRADKGKFGNGTSNLTGNIRVPSQDLAGASYRHRTRLRAPRAEPPVLVQRAGGLHLAFLAACVSCVIAVVFMGCFNGLPPAMAAARTQTDMPIVHILGPSHPPGLDPYILTIHVGDRVVFENDATPKAVHSVIAEDGTFTSPAIQPGQRWAIKLAYEGSHVYHDPTAFAQVVGIIVVVSASTALQSPAPPESVATVVAQAKGASGQNQQTPGTLSGFLWWLLVPVAAGVGGLCYFIYRKRRTAASKHS